MEGSWTANARRHIFFSAANSPAPQTRRRRLLLGRSTARSGIPSAIETGGVVKIQATLSPWNSVKGGIRERAPLVTPFLALLPPNEEERSWPFIWP